MTVKELMERLEEMPESAKVIVIDPTLCGLNITKVRHKESTIHEDGVVQLCTYE